MLMLMMMMTMMRSEVKCLDHLLIDIVLVGGTLKSSANALQQRKNLAEFDTTQIEIDISVQRSNMRLKCACYKAVFEESFHIYKFFAKVLTLECRTFELIKRRVIYTYLKVQLQKITLEPSLASFDNFSSMAKLTKADFTIPAEMISQKEVSDSAFRS